MIKYIALCGYPETGKSEVQRIISDLYGFHLYDDSKPIRDAVKTLYGLTDWHVQTQEGKRSLVRVGDIDLSVRKIMGDLGCYVEKKDEMHFARVAVRTCKTMMPDSKVVFASVRLRQPIFYKSTGEAIVIEVTRTGCGPSDVFDEYDRTAIDFSIENAIDRENPERSRIRLRESVRRILDPVLDQNSAISFA